MTVEWWRTFKRTLHADVSFNAATRAKLAHACERWRQFSAGRVELDIVYDVDFRDIESLRQHVHEKHDLVLALTSRSKMTRYLVDSIGLSSGLTLQGATQTLDSGAQNIYFVTDSIEDKDFEAVAVHEFGHEIGLPDLPVLGALMSGVALSDARVQDFTGDDAALCRAYRYCP